MSNQGEQYNQIIEEAYENYLNGGDVKWLKQVEVHTPIGKTNIPIPYSKEEFINKCKTDEEFSERWELKIEEKNLTEEERLHLVPNSKAIIEDVNSFVNFQQKTVKDYLDELNEYIPAKLITITYKGTTVEVYE